MKEKQIVKELKSIRKSLEQLNNTMAILFYNLFEKGDDEQEEAHEKLKREDYKITHSNQLNQPSYFG